MEKITRMEFWILEHKIEYNNFLSLTGTLFLSRDFTGTRYKDNNGKIWVKFDKTGYYCDIELLPFTKQ